MTVIHAEEVPALGIAKVVEKALAVVGDGPTYVSFDIDGIDPAFAPGIGTPEGGGLTTREVLEILRGLKGLNIIAGDVLEVPRKYDSHTHKAPIGAPAPIMLLCPRTLALRTGTQCVSKCLSGL